MESAAVAMNRALKSNDSESMTQRDICRWSRDVMAYSSFVTLFSQCYIKCSAYYVYEPKNVGY